MSDHLYRPKGSPYWHYDFRVNGRRFHGSTKTAKRPAARRHVERLRAEILAGTFKAPAPEVTVNAAFARWLSEYGRHLKEAANLGARLNRLNAYLGAGRLLSEVSADILASYVARHRGDFGPATVNHDLRTLRRVLNVAAKIWGAAVPPALPWRDLMLTLPAPRQRHLSPKEEARLLAELPPDLAAMVRFAILTGARLDTLRRLQWRDVGDTAITLRDVKSRREGECHVLPIAGEIRALLDAQHGQHPTHVFTYLCRRTTHDRKGGVREAGKRYPLSRDGWRKTWERALLTAGIEHFRFHDLRHTAGTRITAAAGLRVAKEALGHRSIATTARYAHVLLEDVAAGIEAASRNSTEKESRRDEPNRLNACVSTTNEGNPS